jgi:hypothetical protein
MKITNELLQKWGACPDGKTWFNAQTEINGKKIIVNFIAANAHLDWANWLICRMFTHKQNVKYAIFAAEQVLELFEKKYPDDTRPRQAIEAARTVLKINSVKTRAAADAAGDAAGEAARAAAWAVARDAAWAVARATGVAADAARDSAWAAARDAAWAAGVAAGKAVQIKILNYGLSLI